MSNPGPATTVTSTQTFTEKSSGGFCMGQSTTDLISFYGSAGVAQQASTVDLVAQLVNLGLIASGTSYQGAAPVNATGALTVTPAAHAGRVVTLNAAAGQAVTLPAATGTGNVYTLQLATTITSNSTTITTGVTGASSDAFQGYVLTEDGGTMTGWPATAGAGGSDKITFNGSTTGGFAGDWVRLTDVAAGQWMLEAATKSTGTAATPLSHV